MKNYIIVIISIFALLSCEEEFVTPKKSGWPRLTYDKATYKMYSNPIIPYSFNLSNQSVLITKDNNCIDIYYPNMEATIYMTYKSLKNNTEVVLKEIEKLTYHHIVKASGIKDNPFEDRKNNKYGTLYEVRGEVASPIQFLLTDSVSNILNGSLYFYSKPNEDSIAPAVEYIKKDIKEIMESLKWKK
ncbi:gliding motility lipoprotein GldD [Ichthyobacterium seriolicida]|uniref:Gliding motility protein GldD n=1 Tax=Ichthyobacterium seriolicida TaxID=242600 RepID=A0A1J1EBM8_9FLAO|nr:gliding motility lipoprotein GldD [Ichthyobacterium seriolicida]BAV95339.1 gliding motility protein GldD [Ichthyobacterium seriolicida]